MMIRCLFFLCLSLLTAEEIVVQLPTQKQLQPIYISAIHAHNSPFDAKYCQELEGILLFDFEHNGRTHLMPRVPKYETALADENYQKAFYPKIWQDISAPYVIKAKIVNKQLQTAVYLSASSVIKHFKAIDLTGRLCDDRRSVHRLSDGIFQDIFKQQGIAATKILYAFQATKTRSDSEIWECDYDGGNPHPLTKEGVQSLTPIAVGDDHFLYACYKSGQTKIFVGQKGQLLGQSFIHLGGNQFHPTINKTKNLLAFTSDNQGRNDLFLQHLTDGWPSGKPKQIYAYPKSVTASPAFSPDGQTIAFVSDQSGNPKIYLIDTPDNARKRPDAKLLTTKHNSCVCPSWSPDGQKIAYTAKIDGVRQIWVYNVADAFTTQLTTGAGNKENPTWAPNSAHLIYNTTDGDVYDLYLVHINNAKPIKITSGPGFKHYPNWSQH